MGTIRGDDTALVRGGDDESQVRPGSGATTTKRSKAAVACEVWSSFTGTWSDGFEIVGTLATESGGDELVVRRQSDGWVLPTSFRPAAVRRAS